MLIIKVYNKNNQLKLVFPQENVHAILIKTDVISLFTSKNDAFDVAYSQDNQDNIDINFGERNIFLYDDR